MTEKDQLIRAFKSLDFDALQNLLDDNRSYRDVSKDLFLATFKEKINQYENLNSYTDVIEGTCNSCYKGCKAYKFKAEGFPSLNLFFEEKNGKVTDIRLCNELKVDLPDENERNIYFSFYEDEKVNFTPNLKYLTTLQRIEKAVEDFNKLESIGLVPIQEVVSWFYSTQSLAIELDLNDPFVCRKYKAFLHIDSLYYKVSNLVHNYTNNHLAQDALQEFNNLDKEDEKMIVRWLLKNKRNYFFSLKKTENWKKTGIIILETEPNLIVDCSDFLDSFLFQDLYLNVQEEIMNKYEPTAAHYDQNGGRVVYSLENYLKLHNKYLDLL
jgi:hypothetical protein